MSFGSASRPATPPADAPCPCGSGTRFSRCCRPLLEGAPAPTAERLMRSRYTAFALGDAAHLERTWHPRTRPASLDLDASTGWERLEVGAAAEDGDTATVTFRAHFRDGDRRGVLAETSRFARRGGRWFYLDGDVEDH